MSDLSQYLRVDRHQLDEQLEQQAELYYKAGVEAAEARREEARQEAALSNVKRKQELAIRRELADEGAKATNAEIESRVKTSMKYRKALSAYRDAQHETTRAEALRDAFKGRGFALREMVQLYAAEYYSNTPARDEPRRRSTKRSRRQRNGED